ncbi:hypothetical protein EVG20_g7810 [Dentipellis fragilis]|uniref:mannosyl-oligosaccharide 1,2-alpha-mannosidase n=1 Tax=Dentipellis fragilis TaxID=205917 RepID=A0A4Y9YD59_9AGAM|nr:hypothetical protein EVG20_g7810 [Dentipellis fragilis]
MGPRGPPDSELLATLHSVTCWRWNDVCLPACPPPLLFLSFRPLSETGRAEWEISLHDCDQTNTTQHETSAGSLRLLLSSLVFVAVFLLYQYPGPVKQAAELCLGRPTDQLPGTSKSTYIGLEADAPKQAAVVNAFKHAWLAYERDAMGSDEYHPISRNGSNLTTARRDRRARSWVANNMTLDRDANFNTFETTIRVLGGLLSAYHLSGEDPVFLDKARELADRILPVFDTPSGLPLSLINLALRKGVANDDNQGLVSTAEASTLQLEFRYLSQLTDEDIYWKKAEQVMAVIKAARMPSGLPSIFMKCVTFK